MKEYKIEGTKSTPYIRLSTKEHLLVLKGESHPENAYSFYEPVYKLIDEYFLENKGAGIVAEFVLSYINTSSIKCVMLLLDKLSNAYCDGENVIVNWYYDEENGFDYDMGNDFKLDIKFPFNLISIADEDLF